MKKSVLLTASLLAMAGFAGVSSAHSVTGTVTPLNGADIYRTVCFSWGNGIHPAAPVGEVNGAATSLPVTVSPAGFTVTNYGGTFGNGVHYFKITRTGATSTTTYTASFHCQNSAVPPQHTGTGETFSGVPANVNPTVDYIRTQNQ